MLVGFCLCNPVWLVIWCCRWLYNKCLLLFSSYRMLVHLSRLQTASDVHYIHHSRTGRGSHRHSKPHHCLLFIVVQHIITIIITITTKGRSWPNSAVIFIIRLTSATPATPVLIVPVLQRCPLALVARGWTELLALWHTNTTVFLIVVATSLIIITPTSIITILVITAKTGEVRD